MKTLPSGRRAKMKPTKDVRVQRETRTVSGTSTDAHSTLRSRLQKPETLLKTEPPMTIWASKATTIIKEL